MGNLNSFIKDKQIAKRQSFEKDLIREDVVEYFASKSKEELQNIEKDKLDVQKFWGMHKGLGNIP